MTATTSDLASTVNAIYAAFGSGDVPAFMATLADEIAWESEWEDNYAQRPGGPAHFVPQHDHTGVLEFFTVMSGYTFHNLEVREVITGDDVAVARVALDLTMPSGGRFRDEQLHLWRFGPDGKVISLRHFLDTAKLLAATSGEDTTAVRQGSV
jgi:ketosteroid isomerase-like protein